MARTKTQEKFIAEAKTKYGSKYGYDQVVYVNTYTKVKIFCFKHGFFERKPQHFLAKKDAKECRDCMKATIPKVVVPRRKFGEMIVAGETFTSVRGLAAKFKGVSARKLRNLLEQGYSAEDAVELLQSGSLDERQKPIKVNGQKYVSRKDAIAKLKIPGMWLFEAIEESKDKLDIYIDGTKIDELLHSREAHTSVIYLKPLLREAGIIDLNNCYEIRRIDLPYGLQKNIRDGWPSYVEFLEELFPDENIEWWRLQQVPRGFFFFMLLRLLSKT